MRKLKNRPLTILDSDCGYQSIEMLILPNIMYKCYKGKKSYQKKIRFLEVKAQIIYCLFILGKMYIARDYYLLPCLEASKLLLKAFGPKYRLE